MNPLFANKQFIRLLVGYFLSGLGDQIYFVAVPLMVYTMTHSSIAAGTTTAMEFLPTAIFGLFVGVLIDKYSRKRIMVGGLMTQGILISALPFLHLLASVQTVYMLVFLISLLSLGVATGYEAAMPSVVSKHQVVAATGTVSFSFSLVRMVGPAIAGILIAWLGYTASFLVDSASFFLYAVLLLGIDFKQTNLEKRSMTQDFLQGFRFVSKDRILLPLLLGFLLANLGIGAAVPIYLFSMREVLHLAPGLIGVVFAIGSAGGMLGNTLYMWSHRKLRVGRQMMFTGLVITFGYCVIGLFVTSWTAFCLGYCLVSIGSVWAMGNFRFVVQTRAPDLLRGRTLGMSMTLTRMCGPLMAIAGGWIAQFLGSGAVYWLAGFFVLVSMVVSWRGGLWALQEIHVAAVHK